MWPILGFTEQRCGQLARRDDFPAQVNVIGARRPSRPGDVITSVDAGRIVPDEAGRIVPASDGGDVAIRLSCTCSDVADKRAVGSRD